MQNGDNGDSSTKLLDIVPLGLVFLNMDTTIIMINQFALDIIHRSREEVLMGRWDDIFPLSQNDEFTLPINKIQTTHLTYRGETFIAIIQPNTLGAISGYVVMFQRTAMLEEMTQQLDSFKNLSSDLQAIFDISYDVIYVSDGEGVTLRVSSSCEKLWGYHQSELIGKTVYELEKEGVFNPSVTRMVLEKKDKVSSVQNTKTGRRLMVVGTPIKDENGKITRVVNASRDITEVSRLQSELELMKQLTEGYKQELMDLRKLNEANHKIVYRSEKMRNLVTLAQRIASVDSTVLLLGESGVGKEVIANSIHKWSLRNAHPYITFNCGSIPEHLLEYELFGYDKGNSSNKEPKIGLFEMANEGTLFLDEIAELPLSIQVKLLRVLQEQEIVHGGESRPVKVKVRIVASTNRNLEEEVKAGRFREDLYYMLNVIPIQIPPLRERKEDILPLTLHIVDRINQKYGMNKQLGAPIIEVFQKYHWPGNVRELQNVVERLMVTTDEQLLSSKHLPDYITSQLKEQRSIEVNKIIPLKDALQTVEKQLLQLARSKYGSTTKMAAALGVNQSTISRKLQQYDEEN